MKIQMHISILLVALISYLSVGCVSMSTLQTARTLNPDESQQTIGGGVYNSKIEVTSQSGKATTETNLPYIEYTYRHGLMKDLDGGLKVTIVGSYAADVKYQLYEGSSFAAATGLGVGYMEYKVTVASTDTKVKYTDVIVPIYLSYDFNPSFSLYFSPKYILRNASGDASGSENMYGAGIGTKIGEKKGAYLEAAVIKGRDDNAITQYNASFFW